MVEETQLNVPQSDNSGTEGASAQQQTGSVGALLKASRERLGYDLDPLAESLRIRRSYLEAIERSDYSALPGNAYAVGFIRSYAEQLGLDGNELANRFKDEIGVVRTVVPQKITAPEPIKTRSFPFTPILFTLAVAAAAGYGGWYYITAKDQATDVLPSLPASLNEKVSEAPLLKADKPKPEVKAEPKPEVKAEPKKVEKPKAPVKKAEPKKVEKPKAPVKKVEPKKVEKPKAPVKKVEPKKVETPKALVKKAEPKKVEAPKAPVKKAEPKKVEAAKTEAVKKVEPKKAEAPKPAAKTAEKPKPIPVVVSDSGMRTYGTAESGTRVELVATEDTWVQVTQGDTLLLTRVLHPGDRFIAPNRPGLKLMTGNAGGLELKVDGKVLRRLGEQGKVRRGVSLDAKSLQKQFAE